ncbi:hypothetical protein, partial [Rhodoflexus sp.]
GLIQSDRIAFVLRVLLLCKRLREASSAGKSLYGALNCPQANSYIFSKPKFAHSDLFKRG